MIDTIVTFTFGFTLSAWATYAVIRLHLDARRRRPFRMPNLMISESTLQWHEYRNGQSGDPL